MRAETSTAARTAVTPSDGSARTAGKDRHHWRVVIQRHTGEVPERRCNSDYASQTTMSAKLQIEQLLKNDPERDWGCSEMAIELRLTVRTIARVIGELTREGRVYRTYGRRRRMAFRHAPPVAAGCPAGRSCEHAGIANPHPPTGRR